MNRLLFLISLRDTFFPAQNLISESDRHISLVFGKIVLNRGNAKSLTHKETTARGNCKAYREWISFNFSLFSIAIEVVIKPSIR